MVKKHIENLPLITKICRPKDPGKWIRRPRLIALLDRGPGKPLTLILSPAGFGKTTAAAQWLERKRTLSAWLTLDENDNDLDRFLECFVAAIRTAIPEFGAGIESLLSSPILPPPDFLADTLLADLTALKKPFIFVLDDYHCIDADSIQTLVARLIHYLPKNLHIAIIARKDPSLPLGLWHVREWVNELRDADLSFSREETGAFLSSDPRTNISDEAVDLLYRRTEGWVAGLQLANLSIARSNHPEKFARSFSGSNRMVADFLVKEVVTRQPPEIRSFLAVSAMFDRFCAPLCDHLAAGKSAKQDSRRIITLLEKENLFLSPTDSNGEWYRYHSLFQAMLLQYLKADLPPARKARIHCRAGEWFASRGMVEDALRNFIAAGSLDAAAGLVQENLHSVIDKDIRRRKLKRWLALFPKNAESQRPVLLITHAYCEVYHWDIPCMLRLTGKAEALIHDPTGTLAEPARQELMGDIDALRCFCFFWQGEEKKSLHTANRALRVVPKEHRYAWTLAATYAAGSMAIMGRRGEALQLLDDALSQDCSEGSGNAGNILAAKAVIHAFAGNLDGIQDVSNHMVITHRISPLPEYWYGYAHYLSGYTAYERNLLDIAAEQFGLVKKMIYRVNTRLYHDCLLGLALTARACNSAAKAWGYANEAKSFAIETKDPISMRMSDSFNLRLALMAGKVPSEAPPAPAAADSTQFWLETPSRTWAEFLIRRTASNCHDALQYIENVLQKIRRHHNTRQAIQFMILKAVALKCGGSLNEALAILGQVLGIAQPLGFKRAFIDAGPDIAELLISYTEKHPENQYAMSLLDAVGDTSFSGTTARSAGNRSSADEAFIEACHSTGLTIREFDVLKLLDKRFTNNEIADRLFISPETVRKHTCNLYRKLGTHGRRQAVGVARKNGMLPLKN